MKKTLIFSTALLLGACGHSAPHIGGEADSHGCLSSTGTSWSVLKQQCVRVFDIAEIKAQDPDNDTLAVYAILSEDRSRAEVFKSDLPEQTFFTAVKGGYASADGKMRLLKTSKGWVFKR